MQVKSFVMTLGLGMAAGAAAAVCLPKNKTVVKAVNQAADAIESGVAQAKDAICGQ